jgi:Cu+-exporting ATPase
MCKMQVSLSDAPAREMVGGRTYYFSSDRYRDRFLAENSDSGVDTTAPAPISLRPRATAPRQHDDEKLDYVDPICGMTIAPATAAALRVVDDVDYYFCAPGCAEQFDLRQRSLQIHVRFPHESVGARSPDFPALLEVSPTRVSS